MITGYQDFFYNVKDMKKAVQFYCETFGMKVLRGHEFWTTVSIGDLKLGLHWTEGAEIPTPSATTTDKIAVEL